jgi:Flagellar motor switch protein
MPITLDKLKSLKRGDVICIPHPRSNKVTRWKVNGQVQTWKRSPGRVRVPVKHGLYSHDQITEESLTLLAITRAYIEGEE